MFVFVFVFLLIFGYVLSFLCLVDERSIVGFVFVLLLETGLCFCVWLTRKGKKILENLDMCSIFKIWVCGL